MPRLALSVLSDVMDVPLGPRGFTLKSILGRKLAKGTIRAAVGQDDKSSSDTTVLEKLVFMNELAKMSTLYKEAPFKSEAQRRLFYAKASRGEISKATVKKWEGHTPKDKKLPERLHKAAILGALPFLMMTPGKSGLARAARGIGLGSMPVGAAVAGAKAPTPTEMLAQRSRIASEVDRLVELAKHGIEFHSHGPASTDVADPDVKKNGGKTAQVSASSSSVAARTTAGMTSGRPSPSKGLGPGRWHMRGKPGDRLHIMGDAPESKATSGSSAEASTVGAMGGAHVQQPQV